VLSQLALSGVNATGIRVTSELQESSCNFEQELLKSLTIDIQFCILTTVMQLFSLVMGCNEVMLRCAALQARGDDGREVRFKGKLFVLVFTVVFLLLLMGNTFA